MPISVSAIMTLPAQQDSQTTYTIIEQTRRAKGRTLGEGLETILNESR